MLHPTYPTHSEGTIPSTDVALCWSGAVELNKNSGFRQRQTPKRAGKKTVKHTETVNKKEMKRNYKVWPPKDSQVVEDDSNTYGLRLTTSL